MSPDDGPLPPSRNFLSRFPTAGNENSRPLNSVPVQISVPAAPAAAPMMDSPSHLSPVRVSCVSVSAAAPGSSSDAIHDVCLSSPGRPVCDQVALPVESGNSGFPSSPSSFSAAAAGSNCGKNPPTSPSRAAVLIRARKRYRVAEAHLAEVSLTTASSSGLSPLEELQSLRTALFQMASAVEVLMDDRKELLSSLRARRTKRKGPGKQVPVMSAVLSPSRRAFLPAAPSSEPPARSRRPSTAPPPAPRPVSARPLRPAAPPAAAAAKPKSFRDALTGSAPRPGPPRLLGRAADSFSIRAPSCPSTPPSPTPVDPALQKTFATIPTPPVHHNLVHLEVPDVAHVKKTPMPAWRELLKKAGIKPWSLYFSHARRLEILLSADQEAALQKLLASIGLKAVPCDPFRRRDGRGEALDVAVLQSLLRRRIAAASRMLFRLGVQHQATVIRTGALSLPLAQRQPILDELDRMLQARRASSP